MTPQKTLTLLVEQFRQNHKRQPEIIVVHPTAAVILSARKSLGPLWNGIPTRCEAIKPKHLGDKPAKGLGVILNGLYLQGFDLP